MQTEDELTEQAMRAMLAARKAIKCDPWSEDPEDPNLREPLFESYYDATIRYEAER